MTFNFWVSGFLGPQACAIMRTFVSRALSLFCELSGEGRYSLPTVLLIHRLKEKANAHLPFGGQHTLEFFSKWEPAPWAGFCDSQRRSRVPTAKLEKVRERASKLHSCSSCLQVPVVGSFPDFPLWWILSCKYERMHPFLPSLLSIRGFLSLQQKGK